MKRLCFKAFIVLIVSALCLCALEIGIRLLENTGDNYPGFTYKNSRRSLDQELLGLIKKQNVSGETFNIYYFGESTMLGAQYNPEVSPPKLIEYMLGYKINGKVIRSINLATPGQDFTYSLRRLKRILERRNIFYPSLCVIYSGHNEYLKYHAKLGFVINHRHNFSRWLVKHSHLARRMLNNPAAYRLEIDERKYFDEPLFAEKEYSRVIQRYCKGVEKAIRLLQERRVPAIISTVAGNYAEWEPNRSVFSGNKTELDEFKGFTESGEKAETAQELTRAIAFYQDALKVCPRFAETHYRLGKCYEKSGENEKAWSEYLKSADYDMMPIRATSAQNNFLRNIAQGNGIYTVDAMEYLRKHASGGLIGFNLMLDGQHPNLKGYILISELIAAKIRDIFSPEAAELNYLDELSAKEEFGIDSRKLAAIYNATGRWLYRIATWRYDPRERLKLSEACFLKAAAIDASNYEPFLGLAMVNFLRKDAAKANAYLARAKEDAPGKVREYLSQFWVRDIIERALGRAPFKRLSSDYGQ